VRFADVEEAFDADLQLTLADIRGHFGISGGSLKVDGKIKVAKADMVVPPGVYSLDLPSKTSATGSGPARPTEAPTAAAPTSQPGPTKAVVAAPVVHVASLATAPAAVPQAVPKDAAPTIQPTTSASIKRELDKAALLQESKKLKTNAHQVDNFADVLQPAFFSKKTLYPEEQLGLKYPTDTPNPIPHKDVPNSKTPHNQKEGKTRDNKQNRKDDGSGNKENETNYDWRTKINISTTSANLTSSLIASITSSSKPSTPERKRQKNEIITKILAREADRKTLRETFMGIDQIKEEMPDEEKAALSSSEVLHLCEVSWLNKFRDGDKDAT